MAPSEWCGTVGPAVVRQRDAGLVAAPRIDTLAIVSWNVHVGGGDIAGFVKALRAGRFTGGRAVTDFVLLLQEVHRRGDHVPVAVEPGAPVPAAIRPAPRWGPRVDIVQVASALALSLFYVPSMRNGRQSDAGSAAEDRGNAILATRGLTELTAIELPFARHRRIALAATMEVTTPDGAPERIRVASVHFDVLAGPRRLWVFSSGHRARQARALGQMFSRDQAVALGGDLNTWSEGALEDAAVALRRTFEDTPPRTRMATFRRLLQLDHQFFRLPSPWTADVRRLDDDFGSDHLPLLGRIAVTAGG